jgi:predicted component of type VI protein secretion system
MSESPRSPESSQPQQPGRPPESEAQKEKIQRQLDEALAESFPASDPVSIVTSHEEEDWGESESK